MMPLLVLAQVALACAILCNVLFLAWQQLRPMLAPTGIDAQDLILVGQLTPTHGAWSAADVQAGAQALRTVPGVRAVSAAMGLPMQLGVISVAQLRGPTGAVVGVDAYVGYDLAQVLGVDICAGRNFRPGEYRTWGSARGSGTVRPIIITESLARQLVGSSNPLGRVLRAPSHDGLRTFQVVGIVKHLLGNELGRSHEDDTILEAQRVGKTPSLFYAVRANPHMRHVALRGVRRAIRREFGSRVLVGSNPRVEFYTTARSRIFHARRSALRLLVGVVVTMLIVSIIGITGLTGFWIQKRTREIGIRRALGARRSDILMYFQAENAVIVAAAVVVGMVLAYAGNLLLMHYYELPRLPLWYLPVGAAVMLVLGQLAVLAPALRASRVPPLVATRTI